MSSASSSSSSRMSSPSSTTSHTVSNRLVRIKNEPIFPNEEPEPLTIERPGQDGTTSDYVIGTVEILTNYLRNLPPSKYEQKIIYLERTIVDLEQQLAMKEIVAKSNKQSHKEKEMKLKEKAEERIQQVQDNSDDVLYHYSAEYEGLIADLKKELNKLKSENKFMEAQAEHHHKEVQELRKNKFVIEEENKRLKKQLEDALKDKEKAKKEVRAKEAKVAELDGRLTRRTNSLQFAKNDIDTFNKMLKVSDAAEGFKKLDEMCKKQAVKLAVESVRSTPKLPTTSTTKQTAVPPGSKSFAGPVVDPKTVSTTTTSNIPGKTTSTHSNPFSFFPDLSHLPYTDESLENTGTIRFTPFKAPNLEYAGWGGNDVVMGYRMIQQQTSEGRQDEGNRTATSSTRPNAPRRRHSSTSSTTKPSSSRFHPYN